MNTNVAMVYRWLTQTAEEDMECYSRMHEVFHGNETLKMATSTCHHFTGIVAWIGNAGIVTGRGNDDWSMTYFADDYFLHQCGTESRKEGNTRTWVYHTRRCGTVSDRSVCGHRGSSGRNSYDVPWTFHLMCIQVKHVPNYRNSDFDGLRKDLSSLCKQLIRINELKELLAVFNYIFMYAQDKYVPKKSGQEKGKINQRDLIQTLA